MLPGTFSADAGIRFYDTNISTIGHRTVIYTVIGKWADPLFCSEVHVIKDLISIAVVFKSAVVRHAGVVCYTGSYLITIRDSLPCFQADD